MFDHPLALVAPHERSGIPRAYLPLNPRQGIEGTKTRSIHFAKLNNLLASVLLGRAGTCQNWQENDLIYWRYGRESVKDGRPEGNRWHMWLKRPTYVTIYGELQNTILS